jgi:hypothetical protein
MDGALLPLSLAVGAPLVQPTPCTAPLLPPCSQRQQSPATSLLHGWRPAATLRSAAAPSPPQRPLFFYLWPVFSAQQDARCSNTVLRLASSSSFTIPLPQNSKTTTARIPSVSLACHPLDVLRIHIVTARCPSTRSPSVFPVGAAAPTPPRSAGSLFYKAR